MQGEIHEKLTYDYEISKVIKFVLLTVPFSGLLRYLAYLTLGNASIGTYLYLMFILSLFIRFIIKYPNTTITRKLFIWLLLYLFFIISFYLLFPNNGIYFFEHANDLISNLLIGIAGAVFLSEMGSPTILFKSMKKNLMFLSVLLPLVYIFGAKSYYSSMAWGERMYPVALYYFLYMRLDRENNRFLNRILFFIAFIFSLLGGRQSLIFLISGIIIILFFGERSRKKIFLVCLGSIGILFSLTFYDGIIKSIAHLLESFNISSRSLNMLVKGMLFDDFNRREIYSLSKNIIAENGSKINGIFADRYFLRSYSGTIAYAHNIIYELLIAFGNVVGTIILIIFFWKTISKFITVNKLYKNFYIIMWIIGVARCFVSSSVFIETGFLFFIGVLNNPYLSDKYSQQPASKLSIPFKSRHSTQHGDPHSFR